MSKCVLLFGGNLGNVQANFIQAEAKIAKTIGTVTQKSEIYESEAWGFESSDLFLNQVIVIQTKLNPIDILKRNGWGFPGGAVVESPPANAGDTGSSPGPGRSHMPRSN